MRTYTFGLSYPPPQEWIEEIDIEAGGYDEARKAALHLAETDYMSGWTELIDLPRGGSGGWVEIHSY